MWPAGGDCDVALLDGVLSRRASWQASADALQHRCWQTWVMAARVVWDRMPHAEHRPDHPATWPRVGSKAPAGSRVSAALASRSQSLRAATDLGEDPLCLQGEEVALAGFAQIRPRCRRQRSRAHSRLENERTIRATNMCTSLNSSSSYWEL